MLVEPAYTHTSFEDNLAKPDHLLDIYASARAGMNVVVQKAMAKGDAPEVVAMTVLAAATVSAPKSAMRREGGRVRSVPAPISPRFRFRQELAEAQPSAGLMSTSIRSCIEHVTPAEAGREMRKPIVGVIGSAHSIHDILKVQHVGEHSLLCISEVADALPLMFAGCPGITDIDALLDTVDGILLTGARANVHPSCFGVDPDARYEPYDRDRDAIALPLIRACTTRRPLLGICRGLQEMNVAFGGSLHPEVRTFRAA